MKNTIKIFIVFSLLIGAYACKNDAWDDHYHSEDESIINCSLLDMISRNDNLTYFLHMLQATEYDSVLSENQAYTVWAPVNDAIGDTTGLSESEMLQVVKNHISRYCYVSAYISDEEIRMVNEKILHFINEGDTCTFGGISLLTKDSVVNNGVLHTIVSEVPFKPNLWEYIESASELDSLYEFLESNEIYEFDEESSDEVSVNDLGQTVYDSVFNYSNTVFEQYGSIKTEDSTYTMLMPNNDAWTDIYDSISSYFEYCGIPSSDDLENYSTEEAQEAYTEEVAEEAAQEQDSLTKLNIVRNLIFRGDYSLDEIKQTSLLTTTSGNIVEDPETFFSGVYKDTVLSNGTAFETSKMYISPTYWCDTITVEAEDFSYHASDTTETDTRNIYSRDAYDAWLDVSEGYFLEVDPTSLTTQPYITFYLPNTLSTTYNIYCVFLPLNVNNSSMDSSKVLPGKYRFTLSYINPSGNVTKRTYSTSGDIYTSNAFTKTKMLVTQASDGTESPITFPYCEYGYATTNVKLEVKNIVKNSETSEYTREMYIDCIILEPVF